MDIEEWRTIPGHEGYAGHYWYEVSNRWAIRNGKTQRVLRPAYSSMKAGPTYILKTMIGPTTISAERAHWLAFGHFGRN